MLCDQQLMFVCTVSQPHRGRNDGGGGGGGSSGGGRHKKRVRQPHNTREKHRELAINKGEYISPQNVLYQSPQVIILRPYKPINSNILMHFANLVLSKMIFHRRCIWRMEPCFQILVQHHGHRAQIASR